MAANIVSGIASNSFSPFIYSFLGIASAVALIGAGVFAYTSAQNVGAPVAWQWGALLVAVGVYGIGVLGSPWLGIASTCSLLVMALFNSPSGPGLSPSGPDLTWFAALDSELTAGMAQYMKMRLRGASADKLQRSINYWSHLTTFSPIFEEKEVFFTPPAQIALPSACSTPSPVEVQVVSNLMGIVSYMMSLSPKEFVALFSAGHPMHPGGGIKFGCKAQEEILCANSNLALVIDPSYNPRVIDQLADAGCLGYNPQWFQEGVHRGDQVDGRWPYGFSYLQYLVESEQVQFATEYMRVFKGYQSAYDQCTGAPNEKAKAGVAAVCPEAFREAVHALYQLQRERPELPIVMGRSFYYLGEGGVLSGRGIWGRGENRRPAFFISTAAPDFRGLSPEPFIDGIGCAHSANDALVKEVVRNATVCALQRAVEAGCDRIILSAFGTGVFLGNRKKLKDPFAPYAEGMTEAILCMRAAGVNLPKIDFLFLGRGDADCCNRFKTALREKGLIV